MYVKKPQQSELPVLIVLQEDIKPALDVELKWMCMWVFVVSLGLFSPWMLLKFSPFLAVTFPNTKDN